MVVLFGPHAESPVTMGLAVSTIECPPSFSRLWASHDDDEVLLIRTLRSQPVVLSITSSLCVRRYKFNPTDSILCMEYLVHSILSTVYLVSSVLTD